MLLFLLLPLLTLAYVGWHVWLLLPLKGIVGSLILLLMVGAFAMLFASIFRATDRLPMPVATAVYEVGTSSIIVLLYLGLLFFVLDIARLAHLLPAAWLRDNWWTAGCIVLFLLSLFAYANRHYRHKYREEVTLRSTKVEKPVKLVLMSDLHLGYHNRRKEFARWVDLINKEHPDMVLVAGDIIDGSMRPLREERMHEEFLRIDAPIFACLGNHEYYSGEPEAQRFYSDADICLLQDTTTQLGDLCILGRDDRTNRRRLPLKDLVASADRLFLRLANDQTFYMSNISPQIHSFNAPYWSKLEAIVQNHGRNTSFADTLYVVKGGYIDDESDLLGYEMRGNGKRVAVPGHYFMALLRIKGKTYNSIAFWIEHKDYGYTEDYEVPKTVFQDNHQVVSVDELERLTGIDFFHNLPDDVEQKVEAEYSEGLWLN